MTPAALSGLDLLATAVVLVDAGLAVRYMNPAAENLFEASSRNVAGLSRSDKLFTDAAVLDDGDRACARQQLQLHRARPGAAGAASVPRLHLSCTVTPVELSGRRPAATTWSCSSSARSSSS